MRLKPVVKASEFYAVRVQALPRTSPEKRRELLSLREERDTE